MLTVVAHSEAYQSLISTLPILDDFPPEMSNVDIQGCSSCCCSPIKYPQTYQLLTKSLVVDLDGAQREWLISSP
jgi:hypothetical protein